MKIEQYVNTGCAYVATKTSWFMEKPLMQRLIVTIVLFGPCSFFPTLWQVFTADNIDTLRTWTWPYFLLMNIASFLSISRVGEWHMRLVMFFWVLVFLVMNIVLLIR